MAAVVFDGKAFAEKEIKRLSDEVIKVTKERGRAPKLVTILDPENKGSVVYTNLKSKMATRLGVEFVQIPMTKSQVSMKSQIPNLKSQIAKLNKDNLVDGIMVQMPLGFGAWDLDIVRAIAPEKDIDGLREDSPYLPAAVVAILKILNAQCLMLNDKKVVVIGSTGMVGKALVQQLSSLPVGQLIPMHKSNFDPEKLKNADVIISATGVQNLITEQMIRSGVICIDVGYPHGDFAPSTALRAGLLTPVPGGVGPVTVVCLFENLLQSVHAHMGLPGKGFEKV